MASNGQLCMSFDDGHKCIKPVMIFCHHCNRDLCDLHFSKHRLRFEEECQQMLATTRNLLQEEQWRDENLVKWSDYFNFCIDHLRMQLKKFEDLSQMTANMAAASSKEALHTAEMELSKAMLTGNVADAKSAFDKLQDAKVTREKKKKSRFGQMISGPPVGSDEHLQKFCSSQAALGNTMEQPFLVAQALSQPRSLFLRPAQYQYLPQQPPLLASPQQMIGQHGDQFNPMMFSMTYQ